MNPLQLAIQSMSDKSFYPHFIRNSCRFNDDDSAALDKAGATAMDDAKIFSLSSWLKRCNLGGVQTIFEGGVDAQNRTFMYFSNSNQIGWNHRDGGAATDAMISTMLFRDITNWYHFFFQYDSTEVAPEDRQRIWVNGIEITAWDTDNQAALDKTCDFGNNLLNIGCNVVNTQHFDGYLAEFHFIDGKRAHTDFAQSKNGVWIPRRYTGAYGSAGRYHTFENSSHFGEDQSGNGNDMTDVNLAANDQVVDTPTNNYCTLNLLDKSLSGITLSDGNLKAAHGAAADNIVGTHALPVSGRWYFEVICTNNTTAHAGICNQDFPFDGETGNHADAAVAFNSSVHVYIEGVQKASYWSGQPDTDVFGICVDMDNLKISFQNAADGQGSEYSFGATSGDTWFPLFGANNDNTTANFGQQGFALTPPAGYKALCTKNLPNPPFKKPNLGFDIVLYTGNTAVRNISDLNFQPDLTAIKNRPQQDEYKWIDSVRGATKKLNVDGSDAEEIESDGLTAFLPNGFSLGTGADGYNDSGEAFVAWCWKIGPQYGFDIVSDIGTGVAHAINHNCGGVPELWFRKDRDDNTWQWMAYHHHALNKTDPETDYGTLSLNNNWEDGIELWNDTPPTPTQFTVGISQSVNINNNNFITYLWRSIPGYSKVFSYLGNANADGPYIHCDFRPKFLLIKDSGSIIDWKLFDTARSAYNPAIRFLEPSLIQQEIELATYAIDFLSNGFKIRSTQSSLNANNKLHIGIAFAELPGKWSNAR